MFRPKLLDTLRGYSRQQLIRDVMAGVIVGVVALPLAIAFAIASGVSPEKGLYTAVIAGFIIAALGGSRVQIYFRLFKAEDCSSRSISSTIYKTLHISEQLERRSAYHSMSLVRNSGSYVAFHFNIELRFYSFFRLIERRAKMDG